MQLQDLQANIRSNFFLDIFNHFLNTILQENKDFMET